MAMSTKLHIALSKPIPQRCQDLDNILNETSIKELHVIFPPLVEHIFGFNNQNSWLLLQTSKSRHHADYVSIFSFLSPENGSLFRLIYKLQCDEYLRYEFSLHCLPYPTRCKFEDGNIPSMYRNKLQMAYPGHAQNMLWLNAFDFFFFHFAFYITNSNASKSSMGESPSENLYFSLLESYLEYFLPLGGRDVPPLAHETAVSPVRGLLSHHRPHHHNAMQRLSPMRTLVSKSPLGAASYPSLLRSSLSPYAQHQHGAGAALAHASSLAPNASSSPATIGGATAHAGDQLRQRETWRTESVIQILVEFLLNQNSMHDQHHGAVSSMAGSLFSILLRDQYIGSVDHVRCVRMLVKHFHFFANSLQSSIYHPVVTTSLDDIKRSVWPYYAQKRLYVFLKLGFQKWPLDSSFRMMLETWLSYIQPGRYLDPNQPERERDRGPVQSYGDYFSPVTVSNWANFIQENLLFYSELFHDFVTRISRTDLSSPKNAYMLYRVAKIYGTTGFIEALRKAECDLIDPVPTRSPSGPHTDHSGSYGLNSSYHGPFGECATPNTRTSPSLILTLQSSEMETSGFTYRLLFSDRCKDQIGHLLCVISQAKQALTDVCDSRDHEAANSLLWWLGLANGQDYNGGSRRADDSSNGRKTAANLEQAAALLATIFGIKDEELMVLDKSTRSDRSANDSLNQPNKLMPPDHVITNEGPRLTPLGRYQVMNGLRKFAIVPAGDPELRPIASYENAVLVRLLYQIATGLNQRFCHTLDRVYHGAGFWSRMLQQLVLAPYQPPSGDVVVDPSPRTPRALHTTAEEQRQLAQQPRISLRFLASYQTLGYLTVLYLLLYMWFGLGPVGFCTVMACVVLVYVAIKAQFSTPRSHQA